MRLQWRKLFLVLILFTNVKLIAQNTDVNLLKSINNKESKFKNDFSSIDAQSVTFFNVAAPAGFLVAGLIRNDKKLQRDAAYIAGAFVVSTIVTQGLKRVVNENRPFQTWSFIVNRSEETGGRSFPSGHTSAAFCTATSLSLYIPKWYVIVPSYLWAASVGWARLYQGTHYPSDVLVGAVVGAGSAWLGHWLEGKMIRHSPLTIDH